MPTTVPTAPTNNSEVKPDFWSGLRSSFGFTDRTPKEVATKNALDLKHQQFKQAKVQATQEQYSISSLKDLTLHDSSKTHEAIAYTNAFKSGNIAAQPTRELKAAAVKGYLNKVYTSKEFMSLDAHNQDYVSRIMFKKYVEPSLMDQGIKPPTYEEWLSGPQQKVAEKPVGSFGGTLKASLASGFSSDIKFAGNLVHNVLGSGNIKIPFVRPFERNTGANAKFMDTVAQHINNAANKLNQVNLDYNSTYNVPDTKANWVANTAGQAIAYVPMYLAAEATGGAALAEEGAVAPKLTETITSLAERAGYGGKVSKLALTSMIDSGEVFGIEKGEGNTTKQSALDAASVAILGPALHGIFNGLDKVAGPDARLRLAAKFKSMSADTIKLGASKNAVGGDALLGTIEEGINQVHNRTANDLADIKIPASTKDRIMSLVKDDDPDFINATKNEHFAREAWAAHFYPEVAEKYPLRTWSNISKVKQAKIISHMGDLQALGADLMPLAHPLLQTEANNNIIKASLEKNPELANALKAIVGDSGVDPASIMTKIQASNKAAQYGLLNPIKDAADGLLEYDAEYYDSVAERNATLKQFSPEELKEYEPEDGAWAELGTEPKISYLRMSGAANKALNAKLGVVDLISPNTDSVGFVYGTEKYLPRNNATKSGKIYFENPEHHLLYIATESKAPDAVKNKAFRILLKDFHEPKAVANVRAGWLKHHMARLIETGHYTNEGNIFNSTKLEPPMLGTKSQKILYHEVRAVRDAQITKTVIRKNPELAKGLKQVNQRLGILEQKAQDPKTALKLNKIGQDTAASFEEF